MKKYAINRKFTFDGKQYWIHADSEEDYIVKKTLKLKELEEGRTLINKDMKFSVWADMCIDTYKTSCSEKRRKVYKSIIRNNINPYIGDKRLRSITNIECQNILNSCRHEDTGEMKSRYLVKQIKYILNFVFKHAVGNKLLLVNPAENLTLPETPPPKIGRALSREERRVFLSLTDEGDRFRLFELMLYCGCRPDEAIKATGGDIFQIDGHNMLHVRGTKTDNSDRKVPIPSKFYGKIKDTPSNMPIAPNKAGRKYTNSSYKRAVKTLRREMNIAMGCKLYRNQLMPPFPLAEDFIPYYFRHTFCTDLQKKGVDVRTAQALMGHADITTTANIYSHSDDELLVEAAKLINIEITPELRPRLHPVRKTLKNTRSVNHSE